MVGGEPYRRIPVLYSKIVIIISLIVIVVLGVYLSIQRENFSSTIIPSTTSSTHDTSNALQGISYSVDDVITSFQEDVVKEAVGNESTYAAYVAVPDTVMSLEFLYINYDKGFEIHLPHNFVFTTSTKGIQFAFPEGNLLISEELNVSIPETWKEISDYSVDASDTPYVRTYRSGEEDEQVMYYTFIQNGSSHVITTSLVRESFENYFPIITSFKSL